MSRFRFAVLLGLLMPFAADGTTQRATAAEPGFQEFRGVTYVERDGKPLRAEVDVPSGEGPFPTVLVVHGGAWRSGNRYQLSKAQRTLTQCGYATVAIDYRLAPKHPWPAQMDDCKSAVRWIRGHAKQYKFDPDRLGGYGYSAGAHLVTLLGVTSPSDRLEGPDAAKDSPSTRLQAVVAGGTPCDFQALPPDSALLEYWLGGTRKARPDVYRAASPVGYVTADDPPMFFFHGERDVLVSTAGPKEMVRKLTYLRVKAQLHVAPGLGHIQALFDDKATAEAVKFLDGVLKAEKAK